MTEIWDETEWDENRFDGVYEVDEVDIATPCEKFEVPLNFPRGAIKSAIIYTKRLDYINGINDINNINAILYKAWIYMAGRMVEYQQTTEGKHMIETYLPYEHDDMYLDYGEIECSSEINSAQIWKDELVEYVANRDPRDAFGVLARNNLL